MSEDKNEPMNTDAAENVSDVVVASEGAETETETETETESAETKSAEAVEVVAVAVILNAGGRC